MWPLKAHYTLWFGSLSGILPYVPIFAKTHLQESATNVGILYFVLPFVVTVGKPLACSIVDHYRQYKIALLITQIVTLIAYGLMVVIPFLVTLVPKFLLWYMFCLLALVANTSMGISISLTDSLVMDEVREIKQQGGNTNYGIYRIWGTVGFGAFGILSGIINEYSTKLDYLLPGLIMFIVIEFLDVMCIYMFYYKAKSVEQNVEIVNHRTEDTNTELEIVDRPANSASNNRIRQFKLLTSIQQTFQAMTSVLSQVGYIYVHYPSLIQYTVIVFMFGILTAFHWSYFFWFLVEIRGKNPILMGLCIFINSFIGEIPIFLIAHKIIEWVGPVFSLCISLAAFAFRYLCYGYLLQKKDDQYWDVLLIETLQGLTFSLFYTVMTHVAQYYADKCESIEQSANNETKKNLEKKLEEMNGDKFTTIDLNEDLEETIDIRPNQNRPIKILKKPSATLQGLMSGCYEGFGLGVGSLIGGFMIDHYGIYTIWRSAAFLSIAMIIFNVFIEIIKKFRKLNRL